MALRKMDADSVFPRKGKIFVVPVSQLWVQKAGVLEGPTESMGAWSYGPRRRMKPIPRFLGAILESEA